MALLAACATDDTATDTVQQAVEGRASTVTPRLPIRDHQGNLRDLVLQSPAVGDAGDAASAKRVRSRENVERIYRDLHAVLAGTKFERELRLPHPDSMAELEVEAIRGWVRTIALKGDEIRGHLFPDQIIVDPKPMGPVVSVAEYKPCIGGYPADEGSGNYGDMQSLPFFASCEPSPDGVFANDPRPYRGHLSCVKDQANRGTCVAFAIASVMEMQHSMMFDKKVDLSEQLVYFNAFGPTYSNDGAITSWTVAEMEMYPTQRKVPYESAWNYNPSWKRTKVAGWWADSCVGYGEMCSDHSKQGKVNGAPSTGYSLEAPAFSLGLGVEYDGSVIWDDDDIETSLLLMKLSLFNDWQLIVGMKVTDAFYAGVAGDGFIEYKGEEQSWYGWHAMHVVSYIDNADLPKLAPKAPLGDGGGYFIVRNSWGPCFGDGGYLYIPYSHWTKDYVNEVYRMNPDNLLPMH